jgi:hypothetical protein
LDAPITLAANSVELVRIMECPDAVTSEEVKVEEQHRRIRA